MAKATLRAYKALLHGSTCFDDDNNPSEGVFHSYTYNQFETSYYSKTNQTNKALEIAHI
jgi:hypothetical protein